MPELSTIYDYMRTNAALLGTRILEECPALHQFDDAVSPRVDGLLRSPFPAHSIAIMGLAKRWREARTAMVVAECGTGKTLISLGGIHVHSAGAQQKTARQTSRPRTNNVVRLIWTKVFTSHFTVLPTVQKQHSIQQGGSSMSETSTLIGYSGRTIGREELVLVPTPPATETHRPIPHHEIVQALIETLGFRHIGVVHDEYAVSPDGMKMFGVLDLATEMAGCRFSIGVRNSHDKSMRLAMTCGYRVFVCSNMAFSGDFTPVLAKHSKSFSLIDCVSVGVDRMQRNFGPMQKQVEAWQKCELTDVTAKVVIYEAFVEGQLEAPKHLARAVHDLYFEPKYEEFRPRTIWSLSNAFTSALKKLDPIPQFKATAKLGEFLETRFSQSF